jgi:hypothetical protein
LPSRGTLIRVSGSFLSSTKCKGFQAKIAFFA